MPCITPSHSPSAPISDRVGISEKSGSFGMLEILIDVLHASSIVRPSNAYALGEEQVARNSNMTMTNAGGLSVVSVFFLC